MTSGSWYINTKAQEGGSISYTFLMRLSDKPSDWQGLFAGAGGNTFFLVSLPHSQSNVSSPPDRCLVLKPFLEVCFWENQLQVDILGHKHSSDFSKKKVTLL